jgi:hypothetical protein
VETPEQNGRAEHLNRTLIERARALLIEHHLPKTVWSEAMMAASYLRNRTIGSTGERTPHELFFRAKPDVSHLRVFGCKAYAYVEKGHRDKLDAVSDECALVGYSTSSKAYRLLRPGFNSQLNVVEAISVRLHENSASIFLSANTEDAVDPMIAGGGVLVSLDPEHHPNETESLSGGGASAEHPTQSGAVAAAKASVLEQIY